MGKDNKLDFNLNFLNTTNTSDNDSDNNEIETKARKILESIFEKIDLCENELSKMTAYKADMLISNLKNYLGKLESNVLNSCIVLDLRTLSKQLISFNKIIEALKILNYAYSLADTNKLKKIIKNDIDKINKDNNNNNEDLSFTKIKYHNNSNINWKILIIITLVIIVICFICFASYQNSLKEKAILQIKNNAYEYLKNKNDYAFNNELNKLSQYELNTNYVKKELINKYDIEKKRIISDIAYNYEHNRQQFYNLKKQYLFQFFNNNESEFNNAIENVLGYKELSLHPLDLPKSGVLHNYTGREAIAPFEIKTQPGENYYIKLVDAISGKTKIVIFLRGGETKKMEIPLGSYKIKRASGETWYGEKYLFGHNTTYTTSDEWLNFKISGPYVEGHTLTLYKVANGNFSTKSIKAEDF